MEEEDKGAGNHRDVCCLSMIQRDCGLLLLDSQGDEYAGYLPAHGSSSTSSQADGGSEMAIADGAVMHAIARYELAAIATRPGKARQGVTGWKSCIVRASSACL